MKLLLPKATVVALGIVVILFTGLLVYDDLRLIEPEIDPVDMLVP